MVSNEGIQYRNATHMKEHKSFRPNLISPILWARPWNLQKVEKFRLRRGEEKFKTLTGCSLNVFFFRRFRNLFQTLGLQLCALAWRGILPGVIVCTARLHTQVDLLWKITKLFYEHDYKCKASNRFTFANIKLNKFVIEVKWQSAIIYVVKNQEVCARNNLYRLLCSR